MRLAPTSFATSGRQVTSTVGMPSLSSSFASVAPLRVPVPQVAGRTTPSTPAARASLAMAWPTCFMMWTGQPLPPAPLEALHGAHPVRVLVHEDGVEAPVDGDEGALGELLPPGEGVLVP